MKTSLVNRQINNCSNSVINNPSGYKCLVLLSMIYMSIMLFNAIMTNRYIGSDYMYVLGGTFTSPIVFLLDNVIAEIYGFKITRSLIFFGVTAQTVFVLLSLSIIHSPHPSFFQANGIYENIFGWSLLRIHGSGCAAYILAMLFNTRVLTQWKILLKGEKFWLRSIGSCTISEALYSLIAILLMELNKLPLSNVLKVVALSYLIKICYNILFAVPSQYLVQYIRNLTNIDVYDFSDKFTPLKFKHLYRGQPC